MNPKPSPTDQGTKLSKKKPREPSDPTDGDKEDDDSIVAQDCELMQYNDSDDGYNSNIRRQNRKLILHPSLPT